MKLLREPLAQFLLIGAALFGIFAEWGAPVAPVASTGQIVITPGLMDNFRTSYERTNGSAPDAKELGQAVDAYVREEVLDREARALGLDRDDTIVRRRLAQRMEFISTADVEGRTASDDELRAYFQKNSEMFKSPDGTTPEFTDVKEAVQRAWIETQRRAAADAAYEQMREHYTVVRQDQPGVGNQ
jgi:hypothetical protein